MDEQQWRITRADKYTRKRNRSGRHLASLQEHRRELWRQLGDGQQLMEEQLEAERRELRLLETEIARIQQETASLLDQKRLITEQRKRSQMEEAAALELTAPLSSSGSAPAVPGRLGDRLIQQRIVTQEQLDLAMERQQRIGGRLGEIIVDMGFATRTELEPVISNTPRKGRLGEMLTEAQAITPDQLKQALDYQTKSGGMLGDILMSLGFITPEQLYRFIANQNNLGRVGREFDFKNLPKLPEQLARTLDAIIINHSSDHFLLAVGTPLSQENLNRLEQTAGGPVRQVLATRDEMEFYWTSIYESELMEESTRKLALEQPANSAHITFSSSQKISIAIILFALVVCLALSPMNTLIVINIMIQSLYFIMVVFKFSIIIFGTKREAQLRFTPEEIAALDERTLPVYTILVPMYKEAGVIPQLLAHLNRLDYPKAKLDIRLLIEEDDTEAQELFKTTRLPSYFSVITVPHSLPKTKPKACNYGLIRARGEYVVIFDAEDRPDPDQLKKVILAFRQQPEDCACIQAKLNYFNGSQNLLTRWFTQEYSMWFELLLPGVMKLNIPIPLGGTSNHFKMSVLREVNAWDPYNVTEDADLGVRLYKLGYQTAIVDSRTWEEANSRTGNWIRQRSRWIKGYMQTWLVHMRNPVTLVRELGVRGFLGFQVMVLATPLLPILNPFYWSLIFIWYSSYAGWIPQLFPGFVYYVAAGELFLGNFLFVYSNVAGMYWVAKDLEDSPQRHMVPYRLVYSALLTPLYWVLMSIAAVKAAYQLITKPFYWEKTTHGLSTGHEESLHHETTGSGVPFEATSGNRGASF